METNFNFKSQPCSSREQSKRLLALGLKKETADCNYPLSMIDGKPCQNCPRIGNPLEQNYNASPAWSLHRLIEMIQDVCSRITMVDSWIAIENRCMPYINYRCDMFDNTYDNLIACIEWLIKEGYFNKEYLV